jgi:hypothetical protein
MPSDLQRAVDSLGQQIDRSVSLDDSKMRLQAYSPHHGPVDAARLGSLLHREVPNEWILWAHSLGVGQSKGPIRLPANTSLGFDFPRVGVPVRSNGLLLGYLWIIDPGGDLGADDLDRAQRCATEVAAILHRDQLLDQMRTEQETQLARDLLSSDPDLRRAAARRVAELRLCPAESAFAAVVVQVTTDAIAADTAGELALLGGLDRVGRARHPRHWLQTVVGDKAVVAFACGGPTEAADFAQALYDATVHGCGTDTTLRVGIGDPQPSLEDVHLSYSQAAKAISIATTVGRQSPVTAWSGLGAYRLLSRLSALDLAEHALHPGLRNLLTSDGSEELLLTLECYLDNAGAVKESAAALFVHRGSLYHRLARIEKIAGVRLSDGEDRLAMHLGLKAARLLGLIPGAEPVIERRLRPAANT